MFLLDMLWGGAKALIQGIASAAREIVLAILEEIDWSLGHSAAHPWRYAPALWLGEGPVGQRARAGRKTRAMAS